MSEYQGGNYGLTKRKSDGAQRLVKKVSTGLASVYYCPFCKNPKVDDGSMMKFQNGRAGVGRGHGLRCGGQATSKIAAHIRAKHPEQLAEKDASK